MNTKELIEQAFTYHPPKPEQIPKYTELRNLAGQLAMSFDEALPDCAEKTLAVRKIQEAIMWINAGIAINT